MLSVTLYEFKKRENSTLRPDSTVTQKTHEAALKEETSLLYPKLIFDFGLKGNPSYYNYAYISDLGNRYYFIREWTVGPGHLWTAELEVDVLASWKNSIGASTQYLLRSSYTYDGGVIDTYYPAKQPPTVIVNDANSPWTTVLKNGTYVLGVINDENGGDAESGRGATLYYAMTSSQLGYFMNYLLKSPDYLAIEEFGDNLTKAFFDPMQYIVSCVWYPFEIEGTETTEIKFGWWTLEGAEGKFLSAPIHYESVELELPKHPQAASRGAYLNRKPFSSYTLYFPGVGNIALDDSQFSDDSLTVQVATDLMTNTARCTITCGKIISVQYPTIGVPISMAKLSQDVIGGVGSITKSLLSGNPIQAITSFVSSAIDFATPEATAISSNGSMVSLAYRPQIKGVFYELVDEDNADLGRPLCKMKVVSQVPGYQQILHPDISLAGTSEENRRIKHYLEDGYFYE